MDRHGLTASRWRERGVASRWRGRGDLGLRERGGLGWR